MLVPPTLRVCTHVCMRDRLYPRATGRAPKCVCLFVPAGMYVCMYAERTHLRGVLTGGAGLVLRNLGNSRVSNETLHDQLSATNATWVSATLYHALLLNFVCVRARACTYVYMHASFTVRSVCAPCMNRKAPRKNDGVLWAAYDHVEHLRCIRNYCSSVQHVDSLCRRARAEHSVRQFVVGCPSLLSFTVCAASHAHACVSS